MKKGDTLYSIAWKYGLDYRQLAAWNHINSPYVIYPNQKIILHPVPIRTGTGKPDNNVSVNVRDQTASTKKRETLKKVNPQSELQFSGPVRWIWPTHGKLIKNNTPIAKKGIDIAGKVGQKINAAAGGQVVYSGSGLLGYGKLIIIKHNDTFLSAYANNSKLLVKENEKVLSGQHIANMGKANNGNAMLHFEIRKNGKPDNPLSYLPAK